MILRIWSKGFILGLLLLSINLNPAIGRSSENPFLRPGGNQPIPPKVMKPAPTPPPPTPRNPNLQYRGFYQFKGIWHFSIFDKSTQKGIWLKKGESSDDGGIQIVWADPENGQIRLKNGMVLSLEERDNAVRSLPGGQTMKKSTPRVANPSSQKPSAFPRPVSRSR